VVLNLLSWPLNFYVIAPLINAPWFAGMTEPTAMLLQAAWHIVFGAILGWYLASQLPKVVPTEATRTVQ
jgi:hypothetical protein